MPKISYVSPYVNRGVSNHFQWSHSPLVIEFLREREVSGNQYAAFARDIWYKSQVANRDFAISIGNINEDREFLASFILFYPRIQMQYKVKIFEKGENILFQNLAITPFAGSGASTYIYGVYNDDRPNNNFFRLYTGISFGTRKIISDNFSYIEIFTAPQFSLMNYRGLGGGRKSNPMAIVHSDWQTETFSQTMIDFSIPVGVGIKAGLFFMRKGAAFSTTLGGETRNVRGGILYINSHNFPQIPFFMEMGFHFGRFRKLERKQIQ